MNVAVGCTGVISVEEFVATLDELPSIHARDANEVYPQQIHLSMLSPSTMTASFMCPDKATGSAVFGPLGSTGAVPLRVSFLHL